MPPPYCLMHRITGQIIPGYRVNAAASEEIHRANHNLAQRGSEYRLVVDVHFKPSDLPQGLNANPA